ncbi:caspase-8 isoform X2 [Clupea harengus]|uniref:Caspase-8 n=1 Tax=Clupea harengus TaxID=7950 RepID=A0A6P8ESC7_CLUHA|nr:caspase-8 isoform X2 [Clupea harengus]
MEFQRRLLQVDQCLSKADVQALAFLCVDLVSKDLSSVSSAEELFSILTDNDLLSSEDTSLLTELLQTCHRQDLIRDFGTFLQPAESCIGPYRKLLFDLSENITDQDLKTMKFLLRKTLPRKKLDGRITTLHLLMEMEKEDVLSSENLDVLKKILIDVCPSLTKRIDKFKRETNQRSTQLSNQINIGPISQETEGEEKTRSTMEDMSHQLPSRGCSGDEFIQPPYVCEEPNHSTEESGIAGASEHAGSLSVPTEGLETMSLLSISDNEVQSHHLTFSSVPGNMDLKQDTFLSRASATAVDLPQYDMKGEKRGVCLIINNHDFSKSALPLGKRDGTQFDESRLEKVFEWLGFEIETKRDCTEQHILSLMEDLSRRDHSQGDCFVCCVLSHGLEGTVYGVDGNQVRLRQLTEPFSGNHCPSLKEKPKLFFIQACQGIKEQPVVFIQTDGPLPRSLSTDAGVPKNSIPADADFLLGMATIPEYASFRDKKEGTWFIQSLCENLQLLVPQGVDLLSILTEVNNDVSRKAAGAKKQMPQPVFSLRKKVIFPIPRSPAPAL